MNFFCDLFFALTHMSIFAEFWSRLFWFKNLHWPKICSSQKAFISETSPEFCFLFKMEEKWVIVILEYCKICNFTKHSVQFSRSVMSDSLRPHELQHARPPCLSPTPGVHSNSCPLMSIVTCNGKTWKEYVSFAVQWLKLVQRYKSPILQLRKKMLILTSQGPTFVTSFNLDYFFGGPISWYSHTRV